MENLLFIDDPTNTMATIDSGNQRAFFREYVMPLLATRFDNVIGNMRHVPKPILPKRAKSSMSKWCKIWRTVKLAKMMITNSA